MLPSFSSFHLAPFVPDHAGRNHAGHGHAPAGFSQRRLFQCFKFFFPLSEDSEEVHYITFPIYFFYVKVVFIKIEM
jgi:hypothetical protein